MLKTSLQFSHQLLAEIVKAGDIVVDATMGNGHDTLYLSKLVKNNGHVFAFDIQKTALKNTKQRLISNNACDNVSLICDSHANLDQYVNDKIKAAIFNLGYLPNGDKKIITQAKSTIQAIKQLLPKLTINGRIILVLYYGHLGGKEEKDAILNYTKELEQKNYQVMTYQFINQINNPPICLCIDKIKG